ncbi:hypothetical protein G6F60_003039 [Rhizopus arrhizus]|nr:hypothetical protein G6F60_003039 [Rhizopus arrhizus]
MSTKNKKGPSQAELLVRTCSEIVAELVVAIESGKDVNLNGIKNRAARRNKLQNQPKLVEIIAAIPEQHKAALLPKLKAKPIRTASGVTFNLRAEKKKQRD